MGVSMHINETTGTPAACVRFGVDGTVRKTAQEYSCYYSYHCQGELVFIITTTKTDRTMEDE